MTVVPAEQLHHQELTAGCTPVAHVQLLNWGWYLFGFIPIVTGNIEKPGYPQWPAFFTDNVGVADLVERVTEKAEELGGTVTTDLRTTDRSGWMKATLIFWLYEVEVSANVSRPRDELSRER